MLPVFQMVFQGVQFFFVFFFRAHTVEVGKSCREGRHQTPKERTVVGRRFSSRASGKPASSLGPSRLTGSSPSPTQVAPTPPPRVCEVLEGRSASLCALSWC